MIMKTRFGTWCSICRRRGTRNIFNWPSPSESLNRVCCRTNWIGTWGNILNFVYRMPLLCYPQHYRSRIRERCRRCVIQVCFVPTWWRNSFIGLSRWLISLNRWNMRTCRVEWMLTWRIPRSCRSWNIIVNCRVHLGWVTHPSYKVEVSTTSHRSTCRAIMTSWNQIASSSSWEPSTLVTIPTAFVPSSSTPIKISEYCITFS